VLAMTNQPPADRPSSEPLPATGAASEVAPPPGPAVEWPDRSHWSEFDAAIAAELEASEDNPPTPEEEAAPD